MKNSRTVIFFIAGILLSSVFLAGCIMNSHPAIEQIPSLTLTPSSEDLNSSLKEFPPEIQGEIQTLAEKYSIPPEYWWFDRDNNKIYLFSEGTPDKNAIKDLQGKQLGNYTIHIEEGLTVNHAMNY